MEVACIRLPNFRAQMERLNHSELRGRPLIVVQSQHDQRLVLDHSDSASGVQPGMPLSQALSRCPQAALVEPNFPLYAERFDALIEHLGRVSPLVEPDPPELAYVGLDGLENLYGGEEGLLNALWGALPSDLAAQIGIAAAKFPALVAARAATPGRCLRAPKDARSFLADFPVQVLPVRWQTLSRLRSFGLHTLGQVAALPLSALQAQFGAEGKAIGELARGIDESRLVPYRREEVVAESVTFASPVVSLGPLLLALEMLLGRAFARPALRNRRARAVTLQASVSRGAPFARRVVFKQPQGDKAGALFALRTTLENARLPGALEDLQITLHGLIGETGRQESLFAEVRQREQLQEAARRLRYALGGKAALYRVRMVEPWSRIPERRTALVEYAP